MKRFLFWLLAVALGEVLGLYTASVLAQEHRIVSRGTLYAAADDCHFFIDPEGEFASIGLDASSSDFLCEYLKGSNAKEFEITMGSPSK